MNEQTKAFLIALLCIIVISLAVYGVACILFPVANADDGVGIIKIPSIQCTFDLSYQNEPVNQHQHIARLFKQDGALAVGNHYNSHSERGGFWRLENVKVGDTAHIEYIRGNGMEVTQYAYDYTCYAVMLVDVVDFEFYHNGQQVLPYADTDLICVTCVGRDSTHYYVAFFERVMR